MNIDKNKKRHIAITMAFCQYSRPDPLRHVLWVFVLLFNMVTLADAGIQNEKDLGLSVFSFNNYAEKLEYEKKILEGLRKLLELEEHEIKPDEIVASELVTESENLSINKETGNYGTKLYTIKADLAPIKEVLFALASTSGKRLIIDEDITKKEISSMESIFLEHAPLVDIIDIILLAKGFESIISDDIIFITIPAKLNTGSLYDYYQEKAIQAYQRAMIKYPNYEGIARAYYELGNFYFTSGFPTIALQEYRVAAEKYPAHPVANSSMFQIGKCYEMLGDIENVRQSYLNFAEKYPIDSKVDDAYLVVGDLWRKQKAYKEAVEVYGYIIEEYPEEKTARLAQMRLGYVYVESNDYASALKTFMDMKNKSLQDELRFELEYQIGNCYYLMGKYTEAIKLLGEFVLYERENDLLDDAYYKLADCFFKQEDYITAYQLYKDVLTKVPDSKLSPYGVLFSGKSLRMINMNESAVKTLREGLGNFPDSAYTENMKFEIGLCYFDDENFDRAFEIFEEVSAQKNNSEDMSVQANIYAGLCLSREGQYKKAIEFYQKALNENVAIQEKNRIYKLIGDCYTELGALAEAVKAYQGEIL
ncbi:MAG: tetratricopeptide repeat protein [Candidatus Scalinduaceae bacterium]